MVERDIVLRALRDLRGENGIFYGISRIKKHSSIPQ